MPSRKAIPWSCETSEFSKSNSPNPVCAATRTTGKQLRLPARATVKFKSGKVMRQKVAKLSAVLKREAAEKVSDFPDRISRASTACERHLVPFSGFSEGLGWPSATPRGAIERAYSEWEMLLPNSRGTNDGETETEQSVELSHGKDGEVRFV